MAGSEGGRPIKSLSLLNILSGCLANREAASSPITRCPSTWPTRAGVLRLLSSLTTIEIGIFPGLTTETLRYSLPRSMAKNDVGLATATAQNMQNRKFIMIFNDICAISASDTSFAGRLRNPRMECDQNL